MVELASILTSFFEPRKTKIFRAVRKHSKIKKKKTDDKINRVNGAIWLSWRSFCPVSLIRVNRKFPA
jgi:hypothetical protein